MNYKYWITLAFDTYSDFYESEIKFVYNGYNMEILRGTETEPHNLFIECNKLDDKKAYEAGYEFFSELAWFHETKVEYLFSTGGGHKHRASVANGHYYRQAWGINFDNYEQPTFSDEQRLALAIHREAINSESKFYRFLSYFRILNIRNKNGNKLQQWINTNYPNVQQYFSRDLLQEGVTDVGKHLYESGRCSISHASLQTTPIIANPDTYDDNFRISGEVQIMKELAVYFMKNDLNIPDRWSWEKVIMMKYLRELIGEEFITKVINDDDENLKLIELPLLDIKVYRSKHEFDSLKGLQFKVVSSFNNKFIIINNLQQDSPIFFEFILDFTKNDIYFDADLIFFNKKHPLYNAELIIDYLTLMNWILGNGRLELWDREKLISRLPDIIPVNINVSATINKNNEMIEQLKKGNIKDILDPNL